MWNSTSLMKWNVIKGSFLATFVIAWTPYAIVAFISSFFSPKLISPLAGTIPGKDLHEYFIVKCLILFFSLLAIFAKSSIYFNPLVYITSNSLLRSKLIFWKKNSIQKEGLKNKWTWHVTLSRSILVSDLSKTYMEATAPRPPVNISQHPLLVVPKWTLLSSSSSSRVHENRNKTNSSNNTTSFLYYQN